MTDLCKKQILDFVQIKINIEGKSKKKSQNNWKDKVKDLIEKLKSTDLETLQQAAWDLSKLGEDKIEEAKLAISTLIVAIKDEDWAVRKISIFS